MELGGSEKVEGVDSKSKRSWARAGENEPARRRRARERANGWEERRGCDIIRQNSKTMAILVFVRSSRYA
jgi:hypothetical protein